MPKGKYTRSRLRKSLRTVEERNVLVEKWQRFPRRIAADLFQKFDFVRRLGMDEAVSAGFVGLIRAAELWDSSAGVKFSTYAYWSIRQRIIRDAEVCQEWLTPSRNSPAPPDFMRGFQVQHRHEDCDRLCLEAVSTEPEDESTDDVDNLDVRSALACLSKTDREVVVQHAMNGVPLAELAPGLGVSRQRVSQLWVRSLRKMRSLFGVLTKHDERQIKKQTERDKVKWKRQLERQRAKENLPQQPE